jgi:hypothetical protein
VHWLASRVLHDALQGLDIVVKNSQRGILEQRVYLSVLGELIVAREGKRTTRSVEGKLVPFGEIEQVAVAENPEKARKLYIVVRGLNVGKIGRSVGKWVNSSNEYNYRLTPIRIHMKGGGKWESLLEEGGAEFSASRWDLAIIYETAVQLSVGNNKVSCIRFKNAGKYW